MGHHLRAASSAVLVRTWSPSLSSERFLLALCAPAPERPATVPGADVSSSHLPSEVSQENRTKPCAEEVPDSSDGGMRKAGGVNHNVLGDLEDMSGLKDIPGRQHSEGKGYEARMILGRIQAGTREA